MFTILPYANEQTFVAELLELWEDWTTPASEKVAKSAESSNVGVADTTSPCFSGVKERRFYEIGRHCGGEGGHAEEPEDEQWTQLLRLP